MRNKKFTIPSDNPPECNIVYKDSNIIYDEAMNQKLIDFFHHHNKSFSFSIRKNDELFKYMMDVSYPINFINLNLETRVKWISEHMQRFPL